MNNLNEFLTEVKDQAKARGLKCAIMIIASDDPAIEPTTYASQVGIHQTWGDIYSWVTSSGTDGIVDGNIISLTPPNISPQWLVVTKKQAKDKLSQITFTFLRRNSANSFEQEVVGEMSFKEDNTGEVIGFSISTYSDDEDVKIPIVGRDNSLLFPIHTRLLDESVYINASDKFRDLIMFLWSFNRESASA